MGETVRVLILAREADAASGLYQAFTSAGSDNNLEPEALVRLALLMGRGDLFEEMPPPEGPSWLVELLTKGIDPVACLMPEIVDITIINGPATFKFSGCCPHCSHGLEVQVAVSLLSCRTWLCPACFGNIKFDHEGARSCLQKNFPDLLQMTAGQSDAKLIDYLRPKLMGVEPLPDIAMALGQEYHFLMNEIILAHIKTGSTTGGAKP